MIKEAPTITPKKDNLVHESLYEIPSCTICLQELNQDIVSLACGHCFHFLCIEQHFEYRGTCPNCQKRAGPKEMRSVLYNVIPNTKANDQLRTVLSSLNVSQRKQVQQLLKEVKIQTERAEKLKNQMQQTQIDLKKQQTLNASLREELNYQKNQNSILNQENTDMKEEGEKIKKSLFKAQEHIVQLQTTLEKYQKKDKQYQQLKRFREIMNQNSKEIVNYKNQLEKNQTPPEERARLFYDMLLLKNLDYLKSKEKLGEYPEIIILKENEISKMRGTIDALKREIKDSSERKNVAAKKYEELRKNYRILSDKARLKGISDIPQLDESSHTSINTPKTQPLTNKMDFQLPQQASFKKPIFNLGGSFGGLKKKC